MILRSLRFKRFICVFVQSISYKIINKSNNLQRFSRSYIFFLRTRRLGMFSLAVEKEKKKKLQEV